MSERTIAVTIGSLVALALLAWADASAFLIVLATSLVWCVIIWAFFIRNPKKRNVE